MHYVVSNLSNLVELSTPITGRRVSDNAVSIAYGARQCGTHTPNALRPGPVSGNLRDALAATANPLMTSSLAMRGVIEIYPHPALVELAGSDTRLPYKVARIRNYWPRSSESHSGLRARATAAGFKTVPRGDR